MVEALNHIRRWFLVTNLTAIAVLVVGVGFCAKWLIEAPDRYATEIMERQIQDVLSGHEKSLLISNEGGDANIDTFLKHLDDLKNVRDLELSIEYSHNTDSFLKEIQSMEAVRVIRIHKCDVSDAGLGYVATLPNLESLGLRYGHVTDGGIEKLTTCPTLKGLNVKPYDIEHLSVRTLVAMPNVERLSLHEPYEKDWLKRGIEQIDHVSSLRELSLYEADLSPENVEQLRARLPTCKVQAFRYPYGGENEEIAPLP
jgi:hypothetical protein